MNYPISVKFGTRMRLSIPRMNFDRKSKFCKFKMADGRHIEMAISRRHIGRLMQISEWRWRITCRYRSRDQNCNFRKFKMANGRHFENALSPYHSCELSDFYLIWYADADFHSEDGLLTKKLKFCKFKMADGRHIENRFSYISAPYWPINAKFRQEMKNHMPI